MVKSSAYHRRGRASPTGQSQKAHIGPRRLSAEYVTPGALLVKQRRYIAWGFESKRRGRHRKMYPGENVGVAKDSSLVALVHGRVKYTHDVEQDHLLCNVLPEPREELLREDLWRYRTEHVASKEENRHLCHLRMKATRVFSKQLVNPPTKPLPRPKKISRFDIWQNPTLPDAPPLCEDR
ncbi:50S ribosomal protein L27, chloroplastic [Cyclospora cayetanensis]|nr:50S ribosomal protein L27, chloroplastic [Cyclospora cayetanensis]